MTIEGFLFWQQGMVAPRFVRHWTFDNVNGVQPEAVELMHLDH
jgi:hypothetical protein